MVDAVATHDGHDLEVVASLLDGDLVGLDRAVAARQVAGCPACSALHRDLVVLEGATRELPTPARTLDFRLTPADAERLREPVALSGRLTDDMHASAAHPTHDTMLVATLADRTVAGSEREAAEALVATCGMCAALHADLVALSAATRAMPTPARVRDYTLTSDDAARLRRGGWRRWVAAFGTSRDMLSRPLAVGLTTLGLAGLLVATVPSALQVGGATSSSAASSRDVTAGPPALGALPEAATDPTDGRAAAEPPNALLPGAESLLPDQGGTMVARPILDSASPESVKGAVTDGVVKGSGSDSAPKDLPATGQEVIARDQTGNSSMILVSGAMFIVGVGLLLIRRAARRFGD